MTDLFSYCAGVVPLRPRVAPWMVTTLASGGISSLLADHGSPLNMQSTAPFIANLTALKAVADARDLACRPYFARKANKCLSYVAAAGGAGFGIEVASFAELRQSLTLGVEPARIVCTAGVKIDALMALCVENNVVVIIDNDDELALICAIARSMNRRTPVGLRVAGFNHRGQILHSRFGYPVSSLVGVMSRIQQRHPELCLQGLQFHLGGYDSAHRASAIVELLQVESDVRAFLDIGGGIPMRYLDEPSQWAAYLDAHTEALEARRAPITYGNDALGRRVDDGRWSAPDAYPVA